MREKLIELIDQVLRCLPWGEISSHTAEDIADRLIDNGVTIQRWIPVTERLPDVAIRHNSRWEHSTESVRVLCVCKQKSGKRMVKEGCCKVYASGIVYWAIPGAIILSPTGCRFRSRRKHNISTSPMGIANKN